MPPYEDPTAGIKSAGCIVFALAAVGLILYTTLAVGFGGMRGPDAGQTTFALGFGWAYVIVSLICFRCYVSAGTLLVVGILLNGIAAALVLPPLLTMRNPSPGPLLLLILPIFWAILIKRAYKAGQ